MPATLLFLDVLGSGSVARCVKHQGPQVILQLTHYAASDGSGEPLADLAAFDAAVGVKSVAPTKQSVGPQLLGCGANA